MAAWTANDFRKRHLEHRLNVLRGFRVRRADRTVQEHCAMTDGAMVTCRVLWSLMGVVTDSTKETRPHAPTVSPKFEPFEKQGRWPATLPIGVTVRAFSKAEFDALPCALDIILVLVAANKCVAHLDEYPDHGVSEAILDRVIDTTIAEINARVS
jgi:hypothetical protein